jgi:hypothetical protein
MPGRPSASRAVAQRASARRPARATPVEPAGHAGMRNVAPWPIGSTEVCRGISTAREKSSVRNDGGETNRPVGSGNLQANQRTQRPTGRLAPIKFPAWGRVRGNGLALARARRLHGRPERTQPERVRTQARDGTESRRRFRRQPARARRGAGTGRRQPGSDISAARKRRWLARGDVVVGAGCLRPKRVRVQGWTRFRGAPRSVDEAPRFLWREERWDGG